ncbi:MAG: carbohydrate ABC transporter permease [Acidimicrobiia bacterium]
MGEGWGGGFRVSPTTRRQLERLLPLLLLTPSALAVGVFVYGFIAWTGYVSLSGWTTFVRDLSFAGLRAYRVLASDFRFQADLRNVIVFMVLFVGISLAIGLALAIALDRQPWGQGFFRNLFLFPMSIAFVVTGVVWQWLLNPSTGYNLILRGLGWENPPRWYIDTTIWPGWDFLQIELLVPLALLAVVVAAVWQMSGFAMAIFLAGLQGVPDELREAARVDGAAEWQLYRHVLLPLLFPLTATIVIVLGHISLKTFDLVVAMTGPGSGFVTDVPGVYMFQTTFRGNNFSRGAAIAVVMLVLVSALIVPYLATQRRGARG